MAIYATDKYVTVSEAADILQVSQSTIRRWIREDRVPTYRLGERRVLLKRTDLDRLITPMHNGKEQHEQRDLIARLTPEQRARGLAVVTELERLHREMLDERGGKPFPNSLALIHDARDQRSRERS